MKSSPFCYLNFFSMAKGNLFLGFARGKVGDIVLKRVNGQQLTAPRVRKPANPRTQKQLFQRAIFSSVAAAYKMGHSIFDHSFEGCAVGAASQSRFMRVNMQRLRALVREEFIDAVAAIDCQGRLVSPGAKSASPWGFTVSEGSLAQHLFVRRPDNPISCACIGVPFVVGETVKQLLWRLGVQAGDLYTIVAFGCPHYVTEFEPGLSESLVSSESVFGYVQLQVKPYDGSSVMVSEATFADVFDLVSSSVNFNMQRDLVNAVSPGSFWQLPDFAYGTIGCIRSIPNSKKRSTCQLIMPDTMLWGVASSLVSDSWQDVGKLGVSDLLLEGSGAIRPRRAPGSTSLLSSLPGLKVVGSYVSNAFLDWLAQPSDGSVVSFALNEYLFNCKCESFADESFVIQPVRLSLVSSLYPLLGCSFDAEGANIDSVLVEDKPPFNVGSWGDWIADLLSILPEAFHSYDFVYEGDTDVLASVPLVCLEI